MKIIISEEAHRDIEEIFKYISKDSLRYAKETVENIYNKIYNLEESPYIGRYIPCLLNKECREIIYKSYRIVYTISETKSEIYIHFIVHGARNFKSVFNKYKF